MDGVIADFEGMFKKHYPEYEQVNLFDVEKEKFWALVKDIDGFWSEMKTLPLLDFLHELHKMGYDVQILTATSSHDDRSKPGKYEWVNKHIKFPIEVNFEDAEYKHKFADGKNILIDDIEDTIDRWNNAGGIGIHYYGDPNKTKREVLTILKGE